MTKLIYRLLPFSKRLFLSVVLLFISFAVCFLIFQYNREKEYKSDLLNMQLQNYNNRMYDLSQVKAASIPTLYTTTCLHT